MKNLKNQLNKKEQAELKKVANWFALKQKDAIKKFIPNAKINKERDIST